MMLENQIIGIIGVFVLTFCLIALYHLIGKIGPRGMRYIAPSKQVNQRDQDRWPDRLKESPGKDDASLLWSPQLDEQAGPSRSRFGEHRETKRTLS